MSDPVSPLQAAHASDCIVDITEIGVQGMLTLRADLADTEIRKAVASALNMDVPETRAARIEGQNGIAWMSPDEVLILCPYDQVKVSLAALKAALGSAHALAVNVSDARASFTISGAAAGDVLAKVCPVDFSPDAFEAGTLRRTRMAQVPAALWRTGVDSFQAICFRSHAQYVFDLLKVAGQPGSAVKTS